MKKALILFVLFRSFSAMAADQYTLTIVPANSLPTLVSTDLPINPGNPDEGYILGPSFQNSYAIKCLDCTDPFALRNVTVYAGCKDTGDEESYEFKYFGDDPLLGGADGGVAIEMAYFDSLPECANEYFYVDVVAVGRDASGHTLVGTTSHAVKYTDDQL